MNIVLIGMPGAGKSTAGVVLSKAAGLMFVDTDLIIQRKTGMLLQDIIKQKGEEEFLKIEESCICKEHFSHSVIATGGSVVYSKKAMTHLKNGGTVVFLDASLKVLTGRIKNFSSRGIVIPSGKSFENIYNDRQPLYRKYADIVVNSHSDSLEKTVDTIMEGLKRLNL